MYISGVRCICVDTLRLARSFGRWYCFANLNNKILDTGLSEHNPHKLLDRNDRESLVHSIWNHASVNFNTYKPIESVTIIIYSYIYFITKSQQVDSILFLKFEPIVHRGSRIML